MGDALVMGGPQNTCLVAVIVPTGAASMLRCLHQYHALDSRVLRSKHGNK